MKKIYILTLLIVLFRCIDLYTTYLSNINLRIQEQNILVSIFNLNLKEFFFIEFILALLLAVWFYLTYKAPQFNIQSKSFGEYINLFFFDKKNSFVKDWLFKIPLRKTILLVGNILFRYVAITSCLFAINNLWVKYVNDNYNTEKYMVNLYYDLNKFYFFDFVIFVIPIILFVMLVYFELKINYNKFKY